MRPLEAVLIVADLLAFVALVLPSLDRLSRPRAAAPPFALAAMAAQVLVEGPRWHMLPAYALTGLLLLAWLLRRVIAARRPAGTSRARKAGRAVGVVLGVLGLAVSATVPVLFPVFRFPRPSGPYGIGTVTYHWVDADRPETFTDDPDDRRELMVQVWYPARPDPSAPRAPYLEDPGILAPLARLLKLPALAFSHLRYVKTNAVPSAPVAGGEPRYPVLLFSHGRGGYRQHNTWQVEELVSHGYVVAAIDHTYAAAGVAFPDGRVAAFDPRLGVPAPGADWVIPYLARDAVFTLDQLAIVNRADPKGILTGRLDLARAGIFGVSMGGAVSAQACHLDTRFRACLAMDVHMPADVVRGGLRQPAMWLSRDVETMRREGWPQAIIDHTRTTMRATFEKTRADAYLVLIPGTYHADYSDAGLLSPLTSLIGVTGPVGAARARGIIGAYATAFFDQHLKGQREELLEGPSARFPEVLFESRRQEVR